MDTISNKINSEHPSIVRNLDEGRQLKIDIQIAGETFTLEPYLTSPRIAAHKVSTHLIGCPSSGKLEELGKALQFLMKARVHATYGGVVVSPKLLGGSPIEETAKQFVLACREGKDKEALKLLKEHSLPKDLKDEQRNPLICWMAQNEMVATLTCALDKGWNPNLPNTSGIYPLHYAATKSVPLTKALLKASANPFVQTPKGNTPSGLAKSKGKVETLTLLILVLKSTPSSSYESFEKSYKDLKKRLSDLDMQGQFTVAKSAFLLGDREVLSLLYKKGSCNALMQRLAQEYPFARQELMAIDKHFGEVMTFLSFSQNLIIVDEEYKKAQSLLLQYLNNFGADDKWIRAEIYSLLGIASDGSGEHSEAAKYHEHALQIFKEIDNSEGIERASSNLGNAYLSLGRYQEAKQCAEQSLEIALILRDLVAEGRVRMLLGHVHCELGEHRKAASYHNQALTIAINRQDIGEQAKAYNNLGTDYHCLGEYSRSVEHHNRALLICPELRNPVAEEGRAHLGLGNSYLALHALKDAIYHFNKDLEGSAQRQDMEGVGTASCGLGNVYARAGKYRKAIERYEVELKCADLRKDPAAKGRAYSNLASMHLELAEYPICQEMAEEAVNIYSQIQKALTRDSWKITIFEEQSKAYFLLLRALLGQGKKAEALLMADFGRSRALSHLLGGKATGALNTRPIVASEKTELPLVRGSGECSTSKMTIESATLSSRANTSDQMLTEKDLVRVVKDLKTTAVFYSSDRKEEGVLHAWVIDAKGGISYKQLDTCLLRGEEQGSSKTSNQNPVPFVEKQPQQLGAAAYHLVSELEEASRGSVGIGKGISRDVKLWYKALIAPLEDLLPTGEGSRLTFIPDASLGIVPFAALQREDNSYLVEHYTLSTAPSLGVLSKLAETHSHSSNEDKPSKGCVVGDPQENLQWAKQEGLEVASALKAEPIIGKNASIDVIQKAISEARWIHFACHGDPSKRTDIHSVYEGALGLAPPKEGPKGGWWHANEIQKIPLSAELVFLSGCDTGKGKIQREGVIGLTRSFLAAGASCVIATQWPIADEATTKLIGNFYRSLLNTRKPKKKAEALREMMLEGIHQGLPPEKWAPFFLEGWPE
ncbi:MAG: CHAT domain-containing protein [Candidatus Obscuribacterales bacterium]